MDILGIGITEIVVVITVALIFLGPAKIVEIAGRMGFYWRTAQRFLREAADAATIKLDQPEANLKENSELPLEEPLESIKRGTSEMADSETENVTKEYE